MIVMPKLDGERTPGFKLLLAILIGAALAIPILKAAVACHTGMATFAEAGVYKGGTARLVAGPRAGLFALVAYLALPFDLVPDFIPVLGFLPGLVLGMVALFPRSNVGLELAWIGRGGAERGIAAQPGLADGAAARRATGERHRGHRLSRARRRARPRRRSRPRQVLPECDRRPDRGRRLWLCRSRKSRWWCSACW